MFKNFFFLLCCILFVEKLAATAPEISFPHEDSLPAGAKVSFDNVYGTVPVFKYTPPGREQDWYADGGRKRVDHVTGQEVDGIWEGPLVQPSILGFSHSAGSKVLFQELQSTDDEKAYHRKLTLAALDVFNTNGVGMHFLVLPDGITLELLPSEYRAFWAGVSYCESIGNKYPEGHNFAGKNDVNSHSVSVMVVNGSYDGETGIEYVDCPPVQLGAVTNLTKYLVGQFDIAKSDIVRISDVAPQKYTETIPDGNFPFEELKALGK